ncbi:MAG: CBS domain-containing protein [Sphingopyxis sp.]
MSIARILAGRGDSPVHSATVGECVADVVRRLTDLRIGAVPVIDQNRVVGIFSERDVIHGLANGGASALERQIGDVMTSPVIGIEPGASALDALSLMTRRRIRHLPVIDGDQLVGFVSIGDLVKHRIEVIENEAAAMRDYITGG